MQSLHNVIENQEEKSASSTVKLNDHLKKFKEKKEEKTKGKMKI